MEKMNVLFIGSEYLKVRFIFRLYDHDEDGILDGYDLVSF